MTRPGQTGNGQRRNRLPSLDWFKLKWKWNCKAMAYWDRNKSQIAQKRTKQPMI